MSDRSKWEERGLSRGFDLEQLDTDLFRSKFLITPRNARGTFGGQLIAHALQAAIMTVDTDIDDKAVAAGKTRKKPHSLRSNFLAAGDSSHPIYYSVKRVRDGKSFAVRNVLAFQKGQNVYVATVSFHAPEEAGLMHQVDLPAGIPGPDEAVMEAEVLSRLLGARGEASEQLQQNLRRKEAPLATVKYVDPFKSGNAGAPAWQQGVVGGATSKPRYAWMKVENIGTAHPGVKHRVRGDDASAHRTAAAFLSDFTLAVAPIAPHGLPNPDLRMLVSLDHTIYFHDDFRVDEWFLYEVHSTWAGHNRGLAVGRMYTQDGRLGMTVFQEILVRMKPGHVSRAKL